MATTNPLSDWSELVRDVLSLVYKRLSFADFARARTVCSSWYSVSRSSSPRKNHIPWLIFKQDSKWQLFNPEEDKFYTTQINQLGLADCRSLATCGNWILVTDKIAYLYIINPFTLEVINLPPLNPNDKTLGNYSKDFDYGFREEQSTKDSDSLCRSEPINNLQVVRVRTAVLWVDERTNDYLVVWTSTSWAIKKHISFCRKGDEEWIKKPCEYLAFDMAYKDKKLYMLTSHGEIRILDFSQDFPKDVPNHLYINKIYSDVMRVKLTTSGNILIIRSKFCGKLKVIVYKMNITNEEWERVDSLEEEEAVVWDLSVTLPTKGLSGIKKDSVYFSTFFKTSIMKVGSYEIPTGNREYFEQCSHLLGVKDDRWFLPCFGVEC